MIAKLRAVWASDSTSVIIGALSIGLGLKLLQDITDKRTTALAETGQQLVERRAQLDDLTEKHRALVDRADEARAQWRSDLAAHRADVTEAGRG